MLEILMLVGFLVLCGALLIGLFKLLIGLVLLPFKLGLWALKGVLALLILIPLLIIGMNVFALGIPILLVIIVLPFLLLFAGLVFLCRLIF